MIVVDVSAQDSPEVSLVEDDHVIETLAPNASNDPFDVGALPRGARRRRNLLDVESRNAPFEVRCARLVKILERPAGQQVAPFQGLLESGIAARIRIPSGCAVRCLQARPAADLSQPCAPPVGLSLATRSPGVGRQPCGAKYPRLCADSKGV